MDLTSNEPFWLIKNGLLGSYPSLDEDLDTEVLIIGGGITGSLMAHRCMEEGYQTALIDRREIANGSTSATTSMLQYEIDVPLHKLSKLIGKEQAEACYWACYDSIDELGAIVKSIKSDCGFEKKSSLYFAAFKKDVADLKKEYEARKAAGIPVKWLEEDEVLKRFGLHNTYGGIHSEQGGSMDAFSLSHHLLQYNQKRGLKIYDKTHVKAKNHSSRGVRLISEDGYNIKAKKVIYCNGYESVEMIKDKFVKLISTYAIVGERQKQKPKELSKTLIWNTADPYIYMRTTDDDRILIGGEDEDFVDDDKRDACLNNKRLALEKKLQKHLPDLAFKTDFVWAGTFGETKDGLPYIGKHPNFPSSYFVLGFGGNGITFSVIGTQVVSQLMRNQSHPLADLFRFRR